MSKMILWLSIYLFCSSLILDVAAQDFYTDKEKVLLKEILHKDYIPNKRKIAIMSLQKDMRKDGLKKRSEQIKQSVVQRKDSNQLKITKESSNKAFILRLPKYEKR